MDDDDDDVPDDLWNLIDIIDRTHQVRVTTTAKIMNIAGP